MDQDITSHEVPGIHGELIGPTPRKVRLCGDGLIAMRIAMSILVLVTASSCWLSVNTLIQMRHRAALQRDGRVVAAKASTRLSVGRTSVLFVRYTFTVNGTVYFGETRIPKRLLESLHNADHILVRYLPANPANNYPDAWERPLPLNFGLLAFIIASAAISIVFIMVLLKERGLACEGTPAVGVVTRSVLKNRAFRIEFDFCTEGGRAIKGSGYSSTRQNIGAKICVLYLQRNPSRSSPYPMSNYCVMNRAGGPGPGEISRTVEGAPGPSPLGTGE
jgi:hypothetical protein